MAKAKIRENGHLYVIELDGKYTKKEQEMLERLGIIEIEEKPKRKKKYKNVEHKKDASKDNDGRTEEIQEAPEEGTEEN